MYACEQTPRLTVHQESVSENSNTTHPLPSQRAEHEQATLPGLVPGALQQGSAAGRVTGHWSASIHHCWTASRFMIQ